MEISQLLTLEQFLIKDSQDLKNVKNLFNPMLSEISTPLAKTVT
jgi:hypothetical protein